MFIFMFIVPAVHKVHRPAGRTVGGKGLPCFFPHAFGIVQRLLSSGAAREENDQPRPAQEELMTPESTSSVFLPVAKHCGSSEPELLLSRCSCITNNICSQQPAALHTSRCKEG